MKHESTRRSILIAFMSFTILFGLATMPTVTSTSPSSPSSFNRALANADVVLATGQNPRGIFYCCGTVAWWNAPKTGSSVGNQFNQVPHTGGAITTDFAAPGVRSFTFFNGFLYFTQQTNGTSAGLVSVDLSNGMKKVLANASSSIGGLFLTFANITPYVYFIADKNIERVLPAGGAVQVLAHNVSPSPWSLIVVSGYVFWYDGANGMVGKVKASGGSPMILVGGSSTSCPRFVFRDVRNIMWVGNNIYWTDSTYCSNTGQATGSLITIPESGGTVSTLYSISGSVLGGLSFSFNLPDIYFVQQVPKTNAVSNGVYKISPIGGMVTKLVKVSFGSDCTLGPTSTTASSKIVYYLDGGNVDKVQE